MEQIVQNNITPCLWFDHQAEEAARFYCAVFPNSHLGRITHYGRAGYEVHGRKEGTVMTVAFELNGQPFTALNGGPEFRFTEAVSFQVLCETQEEIDYYWERLSAGGDPAAQICGWLKDRYGLSWQIVPREVSEWIGNPGSEGAQRAMQAMLLMKKIDLNRLRRAYQGDPGA